MVIEVTDEINPVFAQLGPYCLNATPDPLPTTSDNGITGTWSPDTIMTNVVDIFEFVFTPDASYDCAGNDTMWIEVTPEVLVEVSISADKEILNEGEQVTLTAIPVNGGTEPIYNWYVNGSLMTENDSIFTYYPENGDSVYATIISDVECATPVPAYSKPIILTVNTTSNLAIVPNPVNVLCYGDSNGSIELTVVEGTPPYSFNWSAGDTTQNIYNLPAGNYTVTVTDSTDTSQSLTVEITQPDELKLSISKEDTDYSTTPSGSIDLTVSGGTGNYSYLWTSPNGFTSTEQDISQLEEGEYTVVVTDENNCTDSRIVQIITSSPTLNMDCPTIGQFECPGDEPPIYNSFDEFVNAGSAYSDCGLDIETFRGVEISREGTCPTTITREYTISDSCGNNLICEQIIIIDDKVRPTISCPPDPEPQYNATLEDINALTGLAFSETTQTVILTNAEGLGINAWDNCEVIRITYSDEVEGNSCPTIVTRTFRAYDACGNVSVSCTQTIELYNAVTPVFDPIGPLCQYSPAPELPKTDKSGISGSWSPAVIDTKNAGVRPYTFTPDDLNCAKPITIEIEILETADPLLEPIGPICQFAEPPALPDTTLNNITGTWFPDTINTEHPDTLKFVFTPDAGYDCSVKDSIYIIIDTLVVPQFLPLDPVCQFDTPPDLPEANFNGVTGIWTPSVTQTDSAGVFRYVFEPDPTYNCAETDTLWLEVKPWITPKFDPIGPLCLNTTPPELPAVSNNGISGFWMPDRINTTATGTTDYIFTPDDSLMCALSDTITISIEQNFPPVAENDNAYTVQEYPVDIAILANDSDSLGMLDTTSFALVESPVHGTVLFDNSTGMLTYTPEVGYFGQDTFYYAIFDFGGACEPLGDTARVVIEIDEPNNPPVALNDSFTVACKPLTENLLTNDYDPDDDMIEAIVFPTVEPQHGMVTINSNGSFNYMPDEGFVGLDSFRYEICDNGLPPLCDDALVWIMVLPDVDCDEVPSELGEENNECTLLIPEGFSPNGDGVHDFFQIFCIDKYPDAVMRIFDRAGNKLFEKRHYGNLKHWGSKEEAWWWGKSENKWTLGRNNLPAGNYLYVLELGNGEVRTGTVMIAY
jgi:gliding motility-associated-like protein